ncbi:phospho-sugar mutase [Arthrobacter castelli]|uniref:phospho-sugar mutase n=1 Tax=Arthrobacter castelli TaxID=271431 RepID=UPI000416EDCD|nr:phospho-sugar mutase [Arthrobacter castelli]
MTLSTAELEQLIIRAKEWADADPDPETADQLRSLIEAAESDGTEQIQAGQELADAFNGTLEFGTAGLRAAMGPGPNRMNRVVVRRAATGVAAYLLEQAAGTYRPRAVIGFDARHKSDVFAAESAAIFSAAGIDTYIMPSTFPTPVLAYAVRALECECGIMVTASHNPPKDNGYKVYLGGRAVDDDGAGAQIVPPIDEDIAAHIDRAAETGVEMADSGWTTLDAGLERAYVDAVASLAIPDRFPARDVKIVLTSLQGVGGPTATKVLGAAGFNDVEPVAEQAQPDPNFSTVSFPNPEEPGALDLAIRAAEESGADLVIANDPDADRAAVAAPDPDTGQWRMLRGDEAGVLLGAHMLARSADEDGAVASDALFANSIVSSRMLGKIAAAAGIGHTETLTGFKWISRVPSLTYGYEEALGYCAAPSLVRDKDGISAALLIAELAADLKAAGKTVFDALDELAVQHGLHLTDQLPVRVGNLGLLDAMMNRLREHPPEAFGGSAVDSASDLAEGSADLPPTDGVLYVTRDDTRVIIRPSGTEPKLKCYLEVIVPVDATADLPATRETARQRMDDVIQDVREALGL